MIRSSSSSFLLASTNFLKPFTPAVVLNSVRHGHRLRGKPPGIARSITDRLKEAEEKVDPEVAKLIDIGFPHQRLPRNEELKIKSKVFAEQKKNSTLERLARKKELVVDLDRVKEEWLKTNGQNHIKTIATHYGIYEHLFGYAYFTPRVVLNIQYDVDDENVAPIYFGNTLKPKHVKKAPHVSFDAKTKLLANQNENEESLWTLVLTNPDGHLKDGNSEYVHWFIGNIPNGEVSQGEVVAPYLQPFPMKGTGFHRLVFILYKQQKKMTFNEYKVDTLNDLDKRTFKTQDFYAKHQDDLTPAGLAFYQCDWDSTVSDVFHQVFDRTEPIFEYDFPKPYYRDEEYFPLRAPFNIYLDRFRDPKDVNKDYLVKKLKKTDPFKGPEPPLRFPGAHSLPKDMPQWKITKEKKDRLGWGRIQEIN